LRTFSLDRHIARGLARRRIPFDGQRERRATRHRDPTDFDEIADLVVREDIGTVLAPFIDDASSTDVHRLQ
jgi:hypothetical protein